MKTERPVELRYAFLHPRYGVIPLSDDKGHISPEVAHYYGSARLDDSGTRVKGRGDEQGGNGRPRRGKFGRRVQSRKRR